MHLGFSTRIQRSEEERRRGSTEREKSCVSNEGIVCMKADLLICAVSGIKADMDCTFEKLKVKLERYNLAMH